jgi:DNA-binding Lrp family transcriptional regulator
MARKPVKSQAPAAVLLAYSKLKKQYPFPISLKRISGRHYLYKQLIRWDKALKKYVCVEMQYLGAIADDGTFKPRKMVANDIEAARAVIAAHGGKVTMPDSGMAEPILGNAITELDGRILTELTMDGRLQTSELAQRLSVEERKAGYRIRALEKKFGITYHPKINTEAFGYLHFLVFVKFKEAPRPNPQQLQKELSSISSVQFAAISADGSKYDMVIVIATISDYNATSAESLPVLLKKLRMLPSLKEISAEWYVSYFDIGKGFMPLRQSFLEEHLSKMVWTKRQERKTTSISKNEYATMLALNADGVASFREIEQRNNMSEGSARYSYDGLLGRKVVSGVTICMKNPAIRYNAIVLMEILDEGIYFETRDEFYRIETEEKEGHVLNRIPLVANMGAPYGGLLMVPVYSEGQLDSLEHELYSNVKGIKLSTMVLTTILCGTLPYNRFDNTKTFQYQRLMANRSQKEKR